jgi:hypothetical protein
MHFVFEEEGIVSLVKCIVRRRDQREEGEDIRGGGFKKEKGEGEEIRGGGIKEKKRERERSKKRKGTRWIKKLS